MSHKTSIQNLQDSQLIRIFLDFVQTYHLQYEKISKEISYKCHQATWILASTKATGYGRTESEAYKHALRNMLEILIDDCKYSDFFGGSRSQGTASNYSTFNKEQRNQRNKTSVSKPPQYSQPQRRDFKTQAAQNSSQESQYIYQQPEQPLHTEPHAEPCPQPLLSKYNSTVNNSFFLLNNPNSSNKVPISNSYKSNCKRTTPSLTNSIQYGKTPNQININMNKSVKNVNISDLEINNEQILIENAKRRMHQLQFQLDNINKENDQIRAQLQINNNVNPTIDKSQNINTALIASVTLQKSSSSSKPMRVSLGNQTNPKLFQHNSQNPHAASKPNIMNDITNFPEHQSKPQTQTYSNICYQNQQTSSNPIETSSQQNIRPQKQNHHSKSKMLVPKLKLDILPNYHAKADKSLNDSLMAIYEQKHGNQKY